MSPGALAEMTEGYSGADAMLLAKEMAMRPLRRLMMQVERTSECSASLVMRVWVSLRTRELRPTGLFS